MDSAATAKLLIAAGFSLVPVVHREKRPALTTWGEYMKRPPTSDELAAWFGDGSSSGLALVTGEVSDTIVLDADNEDAIRWIEQQGMPATTSVQTPNGRHWWLRWPGFPVGNTVRLNDLGVDVRGDGGIAVAPPSIHPSGSIYRWIEAPWEREAASEPTVADCPAWLVNLLEVQPDRGQEVARAWSPELQRGQAWHAGPPGLEDLDSRIRVIMFRGDLKGRYRPKDGNPYRWGLRVASAITADCARHELGVPETIRLLGQSRDDRHSGIGWYHAYAWKHGAGTADQEVARLYARGLDADKDGDCTAARRELATVRDAIVTADWSLRSDTSRVKVLAAALAIGWRAGKIDRLKLTGRGIGRLANIDQVTALDALAWLAEAGWLTREGCCDDGAGLYRLTGAESPQTPPHSMYVGRLRLLLHPAFHGGGLNPLAALALGDEPQSEGVLADRLHADTRTIRSRLRALRAAQVAEVVNGGWIGAGGPPEWQAAAEANGGIRAARVRVARSREDRRRRGDFRKGQAHRG